jgi:hypothetical protein
MGGIGTAAAVDRDGRLGVEGEDHRDESVVRADAVLSLESLELLVIGRKARLLSSEEHEYAPPWRDLVFQALEAVTDTGKYGFLSVGHRRPLSGGGLFGLRIMSGRIVQGGS